MNGPGTRYQGLPQFQPQLSHLSEPARALWPQLTGLPAGAVLYGGTAIALRLGHRTSEDFDCFLSRRFDPNVLRRESPLIAGGEVVQSAPDTLTVRIMGVRVSLFGLDLSALASPEVAADIGLPVASLADLGATKVWAILGRAEARDYVDIAALLRHGLDLAEMLGGASTLFGPAFSPLLAMKALTSFEDGTLPTVADDDRSLLRAAVAGVSRIPVIGARHAHVLPGPEDAS